MTKYMYARDMKAEPEERWQLLTWLSNTHGTICIADSSELFADDEPKRSVEDHEMLTRNPEQDVFQLNEHTCVVNTNASAHRFALYASNHLVCGNPNAEERLVPVFARRNAQGQLMELRLMF